MFLNFLTSNSDLDIVSDSSVAEAVNEIADKGGLNVDPGRFVEMLPKLAMGMISIFIVIGVIIIATSLLNKIFSRKKKKDE